VQTGEADWSGVGGRTGQVSVDGWETPSSAWVLSSSAHFPQRADRSRPRPHCLSRPALYPNQISHKHTCSLPSSVSLWPSTAPSTVSRSRVRAPPSCLVCGLTPAHTALDDPNKIIKVIASDGKSGEQKDIAYTNCKVIGNGSFGVVFAARMLSVPKDEEEIAIKKVLQDKRFKVRDARTSDSAARCRSRHSQHFIRIASFRSCVWSRIQML